MNEALPLRDSLRRMPALSYRPRRIPMPLSPEYCGSICRQGIELRYQSIAAEEAKQDVIDYIEMFYGSRRKHSYLGYPSPHVTENMAKVA